MSISPKRRGAKPVRKCHACLLNLGDHCWRYACPRSQWRDGKRCAGFENAALYAAYRAWLKQPSAKTRKELRRDAFRARRGKHATPAPEYDRGKDGHG